MQRPVTDAHVVAQLVERLRRTGLGDLHAGPVVGKPRGEVDQLLRLGAARQRRGELAAAPAIVVVGDIAAGVLGHVDRALVGCEHVDVDVVGGIVVAIGRGDAHAVVSGRGRTVGAVLVAGAVAGGVDAGAPRQPVVSVPLLLQEKLGVGVITTQPRIQQGGVEAQREGEVPGVVATKILVVPFGDPLVGDRLGGGGRREVAVTTTSHQLAPDQPEAAVVGADLVPVVVQRVLEVRLGRVAEALGNVERLHVGAAHRPVAAVAVVGFAVAGGQQVERVVLGAGSVANEVERTVHGIEGRAAGHARAVGLDPRTVGRGRVVMQGVADVGFIGDVDAPVAAGAAAVQACLDVIDVRVVHGLERHRAGVVEDEHDVRLYDSCTRLKRVVRKTLRHDGRDRQGQPGGSEGNRGDQGTLRTGTGI